MAEAMGNGLGYVVTGLGVLLAVWSALLLLGAWFAPSLLATAAFTGRMVGRFPRTRRNLSLVGSYGLSYGLYLALALVESYWLVKMCLLVLSLALLLPVARVMSSGRDA